MSEELPFLSENDAWHLALRWQKRLQERVYLVATRHSERILQEYQCVRGGTVRIASTPLEQRVWFGLLCRSAEARGGVQEIEHELLKILEELEPYVDKTQAHRLIPVSIQNKNNVQSTDLVGLEPLCKFVPTQTAPFVVRRLHSTQYYTQDTTKLTFIKSVFASSVPITGARFDNTKELEEPSRPAPFVRLALGLDSPLKGCIVELSGVETIAYHSAQLRVGAVVYNDSKDDALALLTVTSDDIRGDICLTNDEELVSLPEWVAVIIPTQGLGWTRASSLLKLQSRPPSSPQLQNLRIMSHDIPFPVIGQLISTIGRNLTNLDLSETQAICSEGLGSLLRRCPALKELKIYHDGSFWAKTTRPSHPLPQIEELSLRLPRLESTAPFIPPSEVMRDSLGRLYTLRVEGHVVSDFENNREALKSMLHSVPRIQTFRFHFDITSVSQGRWPYTYPEARTLKWDRMGIDPTSPDALGHFPLDKQCVLAFLSVVKRFGAGGSVLSDFNRDVLGTILSFTSRTKPREIWIQDEGVDASVGRNSVTRAMIRSSLTLSTETLGD